MAGDQPAEPGDAAEPPLREAWKPFLVPILWAAIVAILARITLGFIAPGSPIVDPSQPQPSWARWVALGMGIAALGLVVLVQGRTSRVRLRSPGLWSGIALGGFLVGRTAALADEGWVFFPPILLEHNLFLAGALLPLLGGVGALAAISADPAKPARVRKHILLGVGVAALVGGVLHWLVFGDGFFLGWLHILSVALMMGLGVAWWARPEAKAGENKGLVLGLAVGAVVYFVATLGAAFHEGETIAHTPYLLVHLVLAAGLAWAVGRYRGQASAESVAWEGFVTVGAAYVVFAGYLAIRAHVLTEKVQEAQEPLFSPGLEVVGLVAVLAVCAYAMRRQRGRA